MATFEKMTESSGRSPTGNNYFPLIMAVVLSAAMIGLIVLGIVSTMPIAGMFFGTAAVLAVYLVYTGGAFVLDRRRSRNYLLGR